ncbi:HDOD domain-containing protein [Ideonella paludis]|uniref:HDOD domain-containing protein n=1 Tax=Ideonella paludis TaxID=1233411 RepID=UPI00363DBF6C
MDVYSAGMVLGHLLCGQPLRQERDPWRAIQSAIHDDIQWPSAAHSAAGQAVDDGLRSLVLRAVARDPSVRFADAAALASALTRWMEPDPAPVQDAQHSTLHFLLRRMRLHGDFPALSDSVMRIQRIVGSDAGSLGALSDEIMKDVALTHKLLRLVNTVQFRRSNAAEVTSVARAAALVGFAAIRNMALSVMLLEHMQDKAQAERMRSLFLRALLTAALCDELTPIGPEREESFLAGLLSHLGRLLVQYYLPEEARQIDARVQASGQPASAASDHAARSVLGLSLHELAHGVAEAWQLPPSLLEAMSLPQGDVPKRALQTTPERLRWRTRLAHDMVDTLLSQEPEAAASEIARLAHTYARALGLSADQIQAAVQVARAQLVSLAASLHLPLGQGPLDRRLSGLASPKRPAPHDPELAQQQLEHSIEQVTDALAADSFRLNDVLLMVLQGLQQALDARTVVLALRARHRQFAGPFGSGEDVDTLRAQCRVELRSGLAADLLAAVCIKGKDTLISDAQASTLAPRLPAWLREHTPRSFLLLPLMRQGVPFALIYVAYDGEEALTLSDRELGLVRTLRNQALMAFKTAA